MPKLITIRGNSASGKTSLAQLLQEKLSGKTLYLSQDMIRRQILNAKDGKDSPTISLLITLLDYGYHQNVDTIILEGILKADWYQPVFEHCVDLFNENIFSYYYDLEFDETVRRHLTRPKHHEFGKEALERWWIDKDYSPLLDEQTLTQEQSLEKVANMILDDIT